MKVLVVLVTVAAVVVVAVEALPRKPTKSFPKKFDQSLDGRRKNTYAVYSHQPDEDVLVSADNPFLHTLMAPSLASQVEPQPQDSLLPPEESSYTTVAKVSQGEALAPPPPLDSYSSHSGVGHSDMVPPPVSSSHMPTPQQESSYLSYEGVGEEPLKAPPLPSHGPVPTYMTSTEVLASLVAMAHIPPPTSSYSEYLPADTRHFEEGNGPSLVLRPPSP